MKVSRHLICSLAGFFLLPALASQAQELSTFLSQLPSPGAWARYRIETRKADSTKREPFDLAVLDQQTREGKAYDWIEAGPTNFAGYRDGYLRILVKASPTDEEALNPFLSTVALAYQEPGGQPFKLTDDAIRFMHSQAKNIKVKRQVEDQGPEEAASVKGQAFACSKSVISTTTETTFFTKKFKVVEKGTYWFSPETPFRVVRAEIERTEIQGKETRRKEITVTLKEASAEGAETHFTKPVTKSKGLLGLLFH